MSQQVDGKAHYIQFFSLISFSSSFIHVSNKSESYRTSSFENKSCICDCVLVISSGHLLSLAANEDPKKNQQLPALNK